MKYDEFTDEIRKWYGDQMKDPDVRRLCALAYRFGYDQGKTDGYGQAQKDAEFGPCCVHGVPFGGSCRECAG